MRLRSETSRLLAQVLLQKKRLKKQKNTEKTQYCCFAAFICGYIAAAFWQFLFFLAVDM
jgi:hypothetical protein